MAVYKGEQPYREWLALSRQGRLFETPITAKGAALKRLSVLAMHVVDELGQDAHWADLKDSLKLRATGRIAYNAELIVTALEFALRERKRL